MPSSAITLSSAYRDYARLLRQLHELVREGRGDGEQADDLRDAMDGPWAALSPNEVELARLLSADLDTLGASEPGGIRQIPPDKHPIFREMKAAEIEEDWARLLSLLRQVPGEEMTPGQAARIRARCWAWLGDFESSLTFFDETIRLLPHDYESKIVQMYVLMETGRSDEVLAIIKRLAQHARPMIDDGPNYVVESAAVEKVPGSHPGRRKSAG